MEQEVIATRPKWVPPVHMFAIVTMAGFLSCIAWLSFRPGGWLSESEAFWVIVAVLFALGAVLLVISVWEIVRYLSEIAEVSCRRPQGRHGAMLTWWGTLIILLTDGRTLSCNYVAQIGFVQYRLLAVKNEYAAKEAE